MGNFSPAFFGLFTIPNSLYYFDDKLDVHSKNFGGNFQSSPVVSTAMRSIYVKGMQCVLLMVFSGVSTMTFHC